MFSFQFLLQLLRISLVLLIFHYSVQIMLENALFCRQNARLKIANSTRNSAGRIYPSLALGTMLFVPLTTSSLLTPEDVFDNKLVKWEKVF